MPHGNSGSLGSGVTKLAAVRQAEMVQVAEMVRAHPWGKGSPPQPGVAQCPSAMAKPVPRSSLPTQSCWPGSLLYVPEPPASPLSPA